MRSTLEKRLENSAKSLEEQRREKQRKLARWGDNHDDAFDKNIKYILTIMMFSIILMSDKWAFTLYDDHYDVEVDSQAEREQLRETTTRSEVEKRPRGRSSTVESAGGHHHYHRQKELKLCAVQNMHFKMAK